MVDEDGPGQPDLTKLGDAIWLLWLGLGWLGLRCLVFGACGGVYLLCVFRFFCCKLALGIVGAPNTKFGPNRPQY